MPSIKDSKVVQYISWTLLGVGIVGLLFTGITTVEVSEGVEMIFSIVSAVSAFWLFITRKNQK